MSSKVTRATTIVVFGIAAAAGAVTYLSAGRVASTKSVSVVYGPQASSLALAAGTQSATNTATAEPFTTPPICNGVVADTSNHLQSTSIVGNKINLVNAPNTSWHVLHGLNFRAFVVYPKYAWEHPNTNPNALDPLANYHSQLLYGTNELDEMINNWKVNTVRFQLSEYSLTRDTSSNIYLNYSNCIKNAVRLARNRGLYVILTMQWEMNPDTQSTTSPDTMPFPNEYVANMPTADTETAWSRVNSLFPDPSSGGDNGIIFDIFNEPGVKIYDDTSPNTTFPFYTATVINAAWNVWRNGGPAGDPNNPSRNFVGHQDLINHLRNTIGSTRLLLVEGVQFGKSFEKRFDAGFGTLTDPGNRLAYAVHPYPKRQSQVDTSAQFALYDQRFGYLTKSPYNYPVVITEWSAQSGGSQAADGPGLDGLPQIRVALDLVNYANQNRIPLVASALDVEGGMVQSLNWTTPSANTWPRTNFNCYAWHMANDVQPENFNTENVGQLVYNFSRAGYDPVGGPFTIYDSSSAEASPPATCP